jgi:hypothetical protein
MDEPIRSIVRAARPGGLTSPEPVTAQHGPSGHPPTRRLRNKDKPQNSAARLRCPDGAKITAGQVITRETIT